MVNIDFDPDRFNAIDNSDIYEKVLTMLGDLGIIRGVWRIPESGYLNVGFFF